MSISLFRAKPIDSVAFSGFKPVSILLASVLVSSCATNSQTAPIIEESPQPVVTPAAPPPPTPQSVMLVTQMQAIREELKQLRNSIEQQQFEVENMSQRQRDLFQGLDQRINTLESTQRAPVFGALIAGSNGAYPNAQVPSGLDTGTVPTQQGMVTNIPGAGSAAGVEPNLPSTGTLDPTAPPQVNSVVVGNSNSVATSVAPVEPQVQAGAVTLEQQSLYDQGFDLLKQSRYGEAIGSFDQLTAQYPNSPLADDAMYWVGEANYVNRQYEAAISAFRRVVTQYPGSDRVPEALLKVGYVQYEIGDYAKAKQTFTDVTTRYANHPVAVSAKSRLQRIDRNLSN